MQTKTDINYKTILDFMNHFQEIPYRDPETIDLKEDEKNHFREIEIEGNAAVEELRKLSDLCSERLGLELAHPISWRNRSGTKTKKCLCVQMKQRIYSDKSPTFSIYVEKRGETGPYFRISLDMDSTISEGMEEIKQFHSYLELPVAEDEGLVFVWGSDEWGNPIRGNDNQYEIREKINKGKIRKVQLSKYLEEPYSDNDEYTEKIIEAIRILIPFYRKAVGITDTEGEEGRMERSGNTEKSLNTILYGPPGTGKTYHTVIYAVAICEEKSIDDVKNEDYDDVLKRFNEYKSDGRIAFATFHQSYGYEEFIEGIKPVTDDETGTISYEIIDGVFKEFCEKAELPQGDEINHDADVYIVRLNLKGNGQDDLKKECFRDGEIRFDWPKDYSDGWMRWFSAMKPGDYVLSYYDKSRNIDGIGVILDEEPVYDQSKTSFRWTRKVNWLIKDRVIDILAANSGKYLSNYHVGRVVNMKLSSVLALLNDKREKGQGEPCVFIIDEINRGNISKIFGELITLIEDTKRSGGKEEMSAKLPYSHQAFSVPNNVYILGTMNTADRSIALMDTALRRRFSFEEMMPDEGILKNIVVEDGGVNLNVGEMLFAINRRIEFLYDREHTLGHAYFLSLRSNPSLDKLAEIFKNKVIPLLQEYFYEDYEKIRMILGDDGKEEDYQFVKKVFIRPPDVFKGRSYDMDESYVYRINDDAFGRIGSYVGLI